MKQTMQVSKVNEEQRNNISSVDEMEVILSVPRKDPLVGSEILVGKIEIKIIIFYKISLVVKKDSATILITVLPTHNFWSVTYFGWLKGNMYYQFIQKLAGR